MSGSRKQEHQALAAALAATPGAKVDASEFCECGWPLPFAVVPIRLNRATIADCFGKPIDDASEGVRIANLIGDAFVTLLCPQCERGHSFLTPEAAQRAGRMPVGPRS
jgi:hypothetical protein